MLMEPTQGSCGQGEGSLELPAVVESAKALLKSTLFLCESGLDEEAIAFRILPMDPEEVLFWTQTLVALLPDLLYGENSLKDRRNRRIRSGSPGRLVEMSLPPCLIKKPRVSDRDESTLNRVEGENTMDARYLYAIVSGVLNKDFGEIGLLGNRVYSIARGPVTAVVSDMEDKKLRPERRNLAAHQGVLKHLSAKADLLPMSFGIIVESEAMVEKILERNREVFEEQLQRVTGRAEMGLRVTWDVPNIFEFMVNTHLEMREVRDRLFGSTRDPSQEDKIEIGRMFERILEEDREALTEQVEDVLANCCCEIKRIKCRKEREVMNLACLIQRYEESAFEAAVFEVAKGFDDHYAFDFNGPWAPHNFVDVQLNV